MKTTVTEFKGKPVFGIVQDDGRIIVSFGVKKAEAILSNIEEIKKFVIKCKSEGTIAVTENTVVVA